MASVELESVAVELELLAMERNLSVMTVVEMGRNSSDLAVVEAVAEAG